MGIYETSRDLDRLNAIVESIGCYTFGFEDEMVPKYAQKLAMSELGLSREQVSSKNFSYDTICAIEVELDKESPLSVDEAFAKYEGLESYQLLGMSELGLSREQVLSENFSYQTIQAIQAELTKENPLSLNESFAKYKDLDWNQVEGVSELGLSREQVLSENFGHGTIQAIEAELAKENSLSLDEAFAKYEGLDYHQLQGFSKLGLSREQVSSKNFKYSTVQAIKAELAKKNPLSLKEAFTKYKDLDWKQVQGVSKLGLSREQVLSENSGYSTIKAKENPLSLEEKQDSLDHSDELDVSLSGADDSD